MPSHTAIAAVALAVTMTAVAQQKPDFSGEWRLNLQASTLSRRCAGRGVASRGFDRRDDNLLPV